MARILIVDDEEDNLYLFCEILRHEGYTVDGYTDGNAALSDFKPDFYELAILDYLMPNINGVRLYDELRGKDDSIRGILLTGSQHMKEFEKIPDVISKPVHTVDLVQRVRSVLNPYTELSG